MMVGCHLSIGTSSLFAHDLRHDLSRARTIIEISYYNLLPGAQVKGSVGEWHDQGGAKEGSSYVRMPVAISPAAVMLITDVPRDNAVPHAGEIAHQTRLILDGRDSAVEPLIKRVTVPVVIPESRTSRST